MNAQEIRQALSRATAKIISGVEHLNDAQLVYLLGVMDGMEGSAAALAAGTAAASKGEETVLEFPKREAAK